MTHGTTRAPSDGLSLEGSEAAACLPTLDLSRFSGPSQERLEVAADLREILHRHGFFYLTGHGVDPSLIVELTTAAGRFFALPDDRKLEIEMTNSPQFRGYTRAGAELTQGKPDWREQLDFDCDERALEVGPDTPAWKRTIGPNQWPNAVPELKDAVTRYQAEMTRLGLAVLRAIAVALGQDEDVFDPMVQPQPRQHMKILRYPGRARTESQQGVGAHKDGGLVTILLPGKQEGLRVQAYTGEWIDVPRIPDTFIVNTGELLELATNGFVCADVHAAVSPPAGKERYSIAFFLGASHEGTIPLIDLPADLKGAERGISSDPNNPMFRDVGANHLKARLRSHPDVARAHYADLLKHVND